MEKLQRLIYVLIICSYGPKIHSQGLTGVMDDRVGMCEGGNGKLDVICANSVGVGDSV